jgi:hypothetical protein
MSLQVDAKVSGPEFLRARPRPARAAAAQNGPDPGHQLDEAEGLGDVVVGSDLRPPHPIDLLAAGGQHDDGNREPQSPIRENTRDTTAATTPTPPGANAARGQPATTTILQPAGAIVEATAR